MLYPSYDILRNEADGSVLWLETVETLEAAHTRIGTLSASRPGEYIIFDVLTSTRINVTADGPEDSSRARHATP